MAVDEWRCRDKNILFSSISNSRRDFNVSSRGFHVISSIRNINSQKNLYIKKLAKSIPSSYGRSIRPISFIFFKWKVFGHRLAIKHRNSLNSDFTQVILKRDSSQYISYGSISLWMLSWLSSCVVSPVLNELQGPFWSKNSQWIQPFHIWSLKSVESEDSYEVSINLSFEFF